MMSRNNLALVRLVKRAEDRRTDPAFIRETFVDVTNTMELLSTENHQVIFGRRGSGKTHTILALAGRVASHDNIPIFIDLSKLGSNSSVYNNPYASLSERGTRLFLDIAGAIHEALRDAIYDPERLSSLLRNPALDITALLNDFGSASTEVSLIGTVEDSQMMEETRKSAGEASMSVGANLSASIGRHLESQSRSQRSVKQEGTPTYYVHFGRLQSTLSRLVGALSPHRVWLLMDEWNNIPLDLQPYVADLLRRALMGAGVVVKIATVQHRSSWQIPNTSGSRVGLELGADIFPDVDLDELQIGFGRRLAQRFFKELIFRHVVAGQLSLFEDENQFVGQVFTGDKAFEEFVDSAEGVPRDGISIIGKAAQLAAEERISVPHIRAAARSWHETSKTSALLARPNARALMDYIVETVIDKRKTRGFVVKQAEARSDPIFLELVDERLLHRIRQGVSSHSEPGVRFDAYVVDYGFYVDRKATKAEPLPLELVDDDGNRIALRELASSEVPMVDYRSVRKAVLSLEDYYAPARNSQPRSAQIPGQSALDV